MRDTYSLLGFKNRATTSSRAVISVLGIAQSQGRVLITIDTDFGRLIFRDQQKQSGLVRLPDVPAAMRIQIMEQILLFHSNALANGNIITVRGNRIRTSRPNRVDSQSL